MIPMKKIYWLVGSLFLAISIISGCNQKDSSILYDQEYIESQYQNIKSGYIQVAGDKVSFQEAVFDSDDKAIMYVKEYKDKDFIEYDVSSPLDILLIEFEDFETKYKKVDYKYFVDHFKDYSTRHFYVEIDDNKVAAIIEIYVP